MKTTEIQLKAPSGSPIVGFISISGSTIRVRCFYTRDGGGNYFYEIPEGMMEQVKINYEDKICIDENSELWTLTDVQLASSPYGA